MNSVSCVEFHVVEDKQLYILLGEIKATQEQQQKTVNDMAKRVERMESRINYAIGIVTAIIFFFQAGWTLFTRKVT